MARRQRPQPAPEVTGLAIDLLDHAGTVAVGAAGQRAGALRSEATKALPVDAERIARPLNNLVVADRRVPGLKEPQTRAVAHPLAVVLQQL